MTGARPGGARPRGWWLHMVDRVLRHPFLLALVGSAVPVVLALLLAGGAARAPTAGRGGAPPAPTLPPAPPAGTRVAVVDPKGLPPPRPRLPEGVRICDVVADPAGREPDEESITLCNDGSREVDLGGWRIEDNHGSYTIPTGTRLAAGGRWTVFGRTYNPRRSPRGVYLNNDHDFVRLVDLDGREEARHSW